MARTIAAFFMLCAVALVSGMLTAKLLTYTAETMVRVAASAPIRGYDLKPGYVTRLPMAQADDLNVATSVPVVPVAAGVGTRAGIALPAGPAFVVAVDSLRVRSGPAKASAQLFGLAAGATVTAGSTRNGWVLVTAEDGRTGWVFAKFLRPVAAEPTGASR